jgi:hypothetical protein
MSATLLKPDERLKAPQNGPKRVISSTDLQQPEQGSIRGEFLLGEGYKRSNFVIVRDCFDFVHPPPTNENRA